MPLGFQFLGQKMTIFSNFSILFKICLETIEIQYWSEFGVIWIIFGGFMAILVEHFSPFFIKANIKEFAILNFYKKCMQILNFDWNWLIFGRKHLCMVLQKRYLGKLLKKIFWPIFWPKKSKNDHFCPFFVIFPISRTKKSWKSLFLQNFQNNVFLTPYEGGIYGFAAYLDQNWGFA